MADNFSRDQLDQLAQTIAKAMKNAGASPDPSASGDYTQRDGRSPAQRSADAKKADSVSKTTFRLLTELTKVQGESNRSTKDLSDATKASKEATKHMTDKFNGNFQAMEAAMTKAMQSTIAGNKQYGHQLSQLAGSMDKLEDVLRFDEVSRRLHEVSTNLEESQRHSRTAETTFKELLQMYERLDEEGIKLAGVDPLLKEFDDLVNEFTKYNTDLNKREFKNKADQENMGHIFKDALKSGKVSQQAQEHFGKIAEESVVANAKTTSRALVQHASVTQAASGRLADFATKTFTAEKALDLLIDAIKQVYKSTRTSYATGTEKGFAATLGRDTRAAWANGISSDTIQDVQSKNAMARGNMGRGRFDKSVYDGINELTGITGNRDDAAKLKGSLLSSQSSAGIGFAAADKNVHKLADSFSKLQYSTGMTADGFGELTASLTSDADFRREMLGLNDKEKAAMTASILRRTAENVQLGYSIDQTKEQISLMRKLFDPLSPKSRMQSAVKEEVFLRTQGVNVRDAHAVAQMNKVGGREKYIESLKAGGMDEKAAEAEGNRLTGVEQNVAQNTQRKLAKNDGTAFATEGLVKGLGMEALTSQAWLKGAPQTKEGKADFDKSVGDFDKAVNNMTGSMLSAIDRISAASGSAVGQVVKAAAFVAIGLYAGKIGALGGLLKNLPALGKMIPGVAKMVPGLAKVLPGLAGAAGGAAGAVGVAGGVAGKIFKGVGGAAAGLSGAASKAAGMAGPAGVKIVNGIPQAAGAAAGSAGGAVGAVGKLSKVGKVAGKLGGVGLASLGVMAAQHFVDPNSKAGKVLNSNTVNGAMIGGTVGSFIPVVGTAIGAAGGAAIGGAMDAYDYFTGPKTDAKGNPVAAPADPDAGPSDIQPLNADGMPLPPMSTAPGMNAQSPMASPQTPKPSAPQQVVKPPIPVNKTDADFAKESVGAPGKAPETNNNARPVDPNAETNRLLREQNAILSKLLKEAQDSHDSLDQNGNKSIEMLTKLQRALRSQPGGADTDLTSAAKYNK